MGKLLIRRGNIVNADRTETADILCVDGVITQIGPDLPGDDCEIVDATGNSIDDFSSGSRCALAGGTTMLFDFIIPRKDQSLMSALADWKRKAQPSYCDYAFHGCLTNWNESLCQEMELYIEEGVTSFKHFLAYKGSLMLEPEQLRASFARCKAIGALPQVHAEDGDDVARLQRAVFESGVHVPAGHPMSRPPEVEGKAVEDSIALAGEVGCSLYIVHNTCAPSVDAIRKAQSRGQRVLAECVLPHLCLDVSRCSLPDFDHAAAHVLSPPLRGSEHIEALWTAIRDGVVTVIGTDHCAFNTEQKRRGRDDFRVIPNGMIGLEERLLILWERGVVRAEHAGIITPQQFVSLTSTMAARTFGIYPRKGVIAVGSDADLVVWDPELVHTISAKTHQSRVEINPYEGFECHGAPVVTIAQGRIAYQRDVGITAPAGCGRFIKCARLDE